MAIKQDVNTLLMKKMDRKDFLKHVGIAVIAFTGFSAVIRVLASGDASKPNQAAMGYGSSSYGGQKNG